MKRILNPRSHGVLDYLVVIVFASGPSALPLLGRSMVLSYVLGCCSLALALATSYPLGAFKRLSFANHGIIEFYFGILVAVLPFILGFHGEARWFFVGTGGLIFIGFFLTDYQGLAELQKRKRDAHNL